MLKKNIIILLIIFAAACAAFILESCYDADEDESIVTIYFERNDLAASGSPTGSQLDFIDRLLNFFSTRADAGTIQWPSVRSDLTLTVSSDCFENMTYTIPPTMTFYTIRIPSGCTTTLTITSTGDWEEMYSHPIKKNWGGHITSAFKPGKQYVTIQMLPMTYISSVTASSTVTVTWETTNISNIVAVTSYRIYGSTSINGEYGLITTKTAPPYTAAYPGIRYYYRISCVTALGEGVMCDPVTW